MVLRGAGQSSSHLATSFYVGPIARGGARGLKPPTPRTPLVAKGKEDEKRGERRKKKREEEERAPLGSEAGFATADRYR